MSKPKKSTIEVQGTGISIITQRADDYICITDLAKHKEPDRADHVSRIGCGIAIRWSYWGCGSD